MGKTKAAQVDRREGRRRAWGLKQQGWKQTAIAAALGVTPGTVSQWLKRAREEGVEALRGHSSPSSSQGFSGQFSIKSKFHRRRWWIAVLVPAILALITSLSPFAGASISAAPRDSCAGPVAGQHVYDCAHLLTPAETASLEADAAAVTRAGAPTVVYLQVRDTTAQRTLQDAIDLMNRWNIESRPGAHDGFVMFFNLRPGNVRHGQVALYAGEKYYQHGNLPQAELDRIRTDVMTPLLQNEQTAEGIAAGLQQVAHDLRYGPPPPPRSQVVAAFLGRLPINILALLFAGIVGLLYVRIRKAPPLSSADDGVSLDVAATPGEIAPAIAGALLNGRVADAQIEATILDFARRGLLALEPVGAKSAQVRLLGDGKNLSGYEQSVWNGLEARADQETRTLSSSDLARARLQWSWPKAQLRRELVAKGWYDPDAAAARRRPLYIAGTVGLVAAAISIVLMIMAQEAWALIGFVLFVAASIAAFAWGYAVHDTTVEGEIAAAPWRGYCASVADRAYEPNIENDLPYIVAFGLVGKLAPRLKAASERGYSPAWFRSDAAAAQDQHATMVGFYPYWMVLHHSMMPVSSGSASGGYTGGGAAGGGGGSSGSF